MKNLVLTIVYLVFAHDAVLAKPFEVMEKSILELQSALESRQVSSAQLAEAFLDRIDAYDSRGPSLRAMIRVLSREDALRQAKALDDERKTRGPRGPLHGIPVILKDSIDALGFPTSGGTIALSRAYPPQDAFIVKRLRNAGALILGKTNLDELQVGGFGLSSLRGQTRNPYALDRVPGGSSSGSAVGIAASFAPLGIGADTNGSIRFPAMNNNLCALRPTMGLISRGGTHPGTDALDVLGPMTRTMSELALSLDVLVGIDPNDPLTRRSIGKTPRFSYMRFLKAGALKGKRIGYVKELIEVDETSIPPSALDVLESAKRILLEMEKAGAILVPIPISAPERDTGTHPLLDTIGQIRPGVGKTKLIWNQVLPTYRGIHFASFEHFLAKSQKTLFEAYGPREKLFGWMGLLGKAAESYDPAAEAALFRRQLQYQRGVDEWMNDLGIEALIFTPTGKMAKIDPNGGYILEPGIPTPFLIDDLISLLSSVSGLPTLVVPAGFTRDGLPVGVQFLGRAFSEPNLLGLGYAYEQATRHRRPPPLEVPISFRARKAPGM